MDDLRRGGRGKGRKREPQGRTELHNLPPPSPDCLPLQLQKKKLCARERRDLISHTQSSKKRFLTWMNKNKASIFFTTQLFFPPKKVSPLLRYIYFFLFLVGGGTDCRSQSPVPLVLLLRLLLFLPSLSLQLP